MIKKEILISILILLTAWMNETLAVLDFCLGIAFYYFIFRTIIIYFSRSAVTQNRLQWILNRYHLFLIIHSAFFILLLIYIDFDILAGRGDWLQYDHYAKIFANSIINSPGYIPPDPLTGQVLETIPAGKGYINLIGLIYYIFNDSLILAVMVNVYFVVTSSIIMYVLLFLLFDQKVARIGLYLSAFFPLFMIYEISLLKECFIFFLMNSALLVTYQYIKNNNLGNLIKMLFIFMMIANVRFYLLLPLLVCIAYSIIANKRIIIVSLATIVLIFITTQDFSSGFVDNISGYTISDYIFKHGVTIIDPTSPVAKFNYQIKLSDPIQILSALFNNASHFLEQIPLAWSVAWTGDRIYYVPFLSPQINMDVYRSLTNFVPFFSSVILWSFMFVSLWGLKQIVFNYTKETSVIWVTLLILPLVNVVFAGNTRYIVVVYYATIACIAYGIVHFRWAKDYFYFSWVLMFTLILFVNKNAVIFLPIVLTLSTYIVFQLITWLYKKDKLFFS